MPDLRKWLSVHHHLQRNINECMARFTNRDVEDPLEQRVTPAQGRPLNFTLCYPSLHDLLFAAIFVPFRLLAARAALLHDLDAPRPARQPALQPDLPPVEERAGGEGQKEGAGQFAEIEPVRRWFRREMTRAVGGGTIEKDGTVAQDGGVGSGTASEEYGGLPREVRECLIFPDPGIRPPLCLVFEDLGECGEHRCLRRGDPHRGERHGGFQLGHPITWTS